MALTPEQVQAIRERNGIKTPASTATVDRISKLKSAWGEEDKSKLEGKTGAGKFLRGALRAPLTMLARPVQAVAELAGASAEDVNKATAKLTRGYVAPVPETMADVKKDVGRAIQTVAFGAGGPVSGGATFGLGSSLEAGNDLFSTRTLLNTALGAASGKVLDLVGKPLLNAAGKVIGKVTPEYIKHVASKGTTAIQEFAANHKIMPSVISKPLNAGAEKLEVAMNKPFDMAGEAISKPFKSMAATIQEKITPSEQTIVNNRIKTLQKIEDSRAPLRNYVAKQAKKGIDVKKNLAATDLLKDSVDNTGTIRTKQPGGAIEQYQEFIKPQEDIVTRTIAKEGKTVSLDDVEAKLTDAVNKSKIKGSSKVEALNGVKKEISGLKLDADVEGNIPLSVIHDAKITKYAHVNYLNPEQGASDKLIAKGLKEIVEENSSGPIKELNKELADHYATIGFLEKLDGSKVEGGKLGRYFAKTVGAIAGTPFGPMGTIVGAELAGKAQGMGLAGTFSRQIGKELESSPLMKGALGKVEETTFKTPTVGKTVEEKHLYPLYETAPQAKQYIDDLSEQIAKKYNGKVAKAEFKSLDRALVKVNTEKGGDVSKLNDIVRNTVVVDKASFDAAKKDLFSRPGISNIREVSPIRDPLGYSGATLNIKTPNGHIAEIQVNTPDMIFAKEAEKDAMRILGDDVYNKLLKKYKKLGIEGGKGHKYYEEYREALMTGDTGKMSKIEQESRAYYDKIRNA